MQIYVKTPLFNHSKAVPHMVEHCVEHNVLSLSDFFLYAYGMEGTIFADYTVFEHDERIDYTYLIEKFTEPLNPKYFAFEQNILQEECQETTYHQGMYEHLVQKIFTPNISLNSAKNIVWSDVVKYHQQYYTPSTIIVVDKEYNILYQGFPPAEQAIEKGQPFSFPFSYEEDEYSIVGEKYCNATSYWKLFFLFRMMNFYGVYQSRRQKGTYYYLDPYFHTFQHANRVVIPKVDLSAFSEDFYIHGKQYLLQMLAHQYFKENFFLNQYLYGRPMERSEVIQQYTQYSWKEFQTIINTLPTA